MKKLTFIIALFAAFSVQRASAQCGPTTPAYTSSGSTLTASTPGLSDVTNTLNAVTSSTTLVIIPAGTCGWTSSINWTVPSGNTNLTIQGQTTVSCTGTPGASNYACTPTDNTAIEDNYNSTNQLITITTAASGTHFRMTGLTIEGGTETAGSKQPVTVIGGNSQNIRIDHDHFNIGDYSDSSIGGAVMRFTGPTEGVADHNRIDMGTATCCNNGIQAFNDVGDTAGNGDTTWANPTPWGTFAAIYMESNQINGGYGNDCADGGFFVMRYNIFTNMTVAVQTHGTKTAAGPGRGCRGYEFYNNYIAAWSSEQDAMIGSKGGPAMVWDNTMQTGAAYRFAAPSTDRVSSSENVPEIPTPNGWGYDGPVPICNSGVANISAPVSGVYTWTYVSGCNFSSLWPTGGGTAGALLIDNGTYWGAMPIQNVASTTSMTTTCVIANGQTACPSGASTNISWAAGSSWDGNNTNEGYPGLDALGRGMTVQALNGQPFPNRLNSVTGTIAWPQQYLEPMYLFDNSYGSATVVLRDSASNFNIDLFYENSSFNGTTGTGTGLLSARPSTCTPGPGGTYYTSPTGSYGVGYFATDANSGRGELYVCTSTNTWTGIYEPGAYPHPLVSGGVTLSPSPESFGSVNVGSSSSAVTFTLTNNSSTTATSISPTTTGGNPSDFSINNTGAGSCGAASGSLAASASCTFTVTFTPAATGSRSTTLSVSYSGGDGASPQTSALSGTGTSSGSVTVSPTSQSCGSSIVGIAATCATFTLSNTTASTVTSIVVTFVGTNSGDFSDTGGTCGSSLAASTSCTIIVTFTPGATGSRSGTLNIADSASSSPQQSSLTGTGVAGTVTISPTSQGFGSVTLLNPSSPITFTLTNTNATSVTGITITFVSGNTGDFSKTSGTCTSSLSASSNCTIIVTFTPQAVGSRTTTLNVADSASSSPQQSSLSGTGVAAVTAPAAAIMAILKLDPMLGQTPIPLLMTASARLSVLDQ
jgi:Abnormal spindle-like microcephaly-assoc'd, ASPM-SPD-2-Hydin